MLKLMCNRCDQIVMHKCLVCQELVCEKHSNDHKVNNSKVHNLKNYSLKVDFGLNALKKLKKKLANGINQLEEEINKVLVHLMDLKMKVYNEVQLSLKEIEKLESQLISSDFSMFHEKSTLIELICFDHENAESKFEDCLNFSINFSNILNTKSSQIFKFDKLDQLWKNESSSITSLKIKVDKNEIANAEKTKVKLDKYRGFVEKNKLFKSLIGKLSLAELENWKLRNKVKKISFELNDFENISAAQAKVDIIGTFPKLEKIQIKSLSPEFFVNFFSILNHIPSLVVFSMTRTTDLNLTDFKNLQRFLQNNTLKRFKMSYCNSLILGIRHLVKEINPDNLTHLNISGNLFGAEGCVYLASALKRMSQLKHLNIRSNDINNSGASHLAPSLLSLKKLEFLDISWNSLRLNGLQIIMEHLNNSNLLKYIDISSNGLADEDEENVNILFLTCFKNFEILESIVIDMTMTRNSIRYLSRELPRTCFIFQSNSNQIQPLPKNLRK